MKRRFEITVISSEDLRYHKKPLKNAIVVVRADSDHHCMTKPAAEDGTNPRWNEKLFLDVPLHGGFITVEVHCKQPSWRDHKLVGGVRIPVSDILDGLTPENYVHFLSYRLRDNYGISNGIINISVKLTAPAYVMPESQPELGVPMGERKVAGGVLVTGVPVWFAEPCRH
ncbi:BON1-associated protein 2-like [Rhodamnia argentea]|uniref:BON1-associated protein 2-like n=1 Tax=Rhodamnia argentea TaxID=178133 RepID=A0A8B8PGY4_9MYRT|nr:BON1-associated protein 2-like [Rhodamnia argentea]